MDFRVAFFFAVFFLYFSYLVFVRKNISKKGKFFCAKIWISGVSGVIFTALTQGFVLKP